MLTFLLWEMLRAPKSLNNDDVGELTGSVDDQHWTLVVLLFNIQWMRGDYCQNVTMSAVAEVLGTIIEETGRAATGCHSLWRAASKTNTLEKKALQIFTNTS